MLGSGSRGNAVLLETGTTRVLVDAGFAPSVITERLRVIEVAPESIEALVVTHEHIDHVRGVRPLCDQFGWTAHATAGTIMATPDLQATGAIPFRTGDTLTFGDLELRTMRSSHDAAEPVVLTATATRSGARAGIVYDTGVVTRTMMEAVTDLDLLVLESNHDELMLEHGPYPPVVRQRIAGRNGHLSNRVAGMLARQVAHGGLRHLVLAHLSQKCNTPQTALDAMQESVKKTRFRGRISASPQDGIAGPFEPSARRPAATQLEFGL